jgi:hypothetical protein
MYINPVSYAENNERVFTVYNNGATGLKEADKFENLLRN